MTKSLKYVKNEKCPLKDLEYGEKTENLREKDRHYLRVKGWKTIFQAYGLKKQAGVAILIWNKIDFQPKVIKKDKEGHFILIKGKILQEKLNSEYLCSK